MDNDDFLEKVLNQSQMLGVQQIIKDSGIKYSDQLSDKLSYHYSFVEKFFEKGFQTNKLNLALQFKVMSLEAENKELKKENDKLTKIIEL